MSVAKLAGFVIRYRSVQEPEYGVSKGVPDVGKLSSEIAYADREVVDCTAKIWHY